jgi:hypothetical protein
MTCLFFFTMEVHSQSGNFALKRISDYHRHMARGWESKSVEEQQSEANRGKAETRVQLSAEEKAQQHSKNSLMLARRQVIEQLERAANPRHREMLERALSDLETQIARLC